ncbi:hypothetical protein HZS_2272 [Henneguya salminicola]|nr:hypothetical protein HZS_2272 [Henneguya salminicola]
MIFSVLSIDRNKKFKMFFLKINKIVWNNYKLNDDTCCSKDPTCETPCLHLFAFSLDDKIYEYSYFYTVPKISKSLKYDYYRIFDSENVILKKNLSLIIYVMPEVVTDKFYDLIELKNLSFSKNILSRNIIVRGKSGNLGMDVIVGNVCNGYTSDNCENICHAIKLVEACYYKNGSIECINGATDPKTCERRFS